MATIDVTNAIQDLTHPSAHAHVYQAAHIPVAIDFAKVLAKKGSALAAGDIIRILKIPPKSIAAGAVLEVTVAAAANLTTATLGVGTENTTTNRYITAFDYKAATVGDFATDNGTPARVIVGKVADYFVLVLSTLTGVLDSGVVNVAVNLLDLSDPAKSAGLATRT